MLVSCKGCKSKIDRDTAFKLRINGKNNYYCNFEEYEQIKTENECRLKVIDLAFEIIGKTTNTALMKELTAIAKVHSYTKLLKFMEENMIDLDAAMSKEFVHEYAKIRYFTAIIKNQIGDFKEEKTEEVEVNDNFDVVENVKYTPTKKKSFADFIDEY